MNASVLRMFGSSFPSAMFSSFIFPFSPDTSFLSNISFSLIPLFRDQRDTNVSHPTGVFVCLRV